MRRYVTALAMIAPLTAAVASPPAQASPAARTAQVARSSSSGVVIYRVQFDPPGSDRGSNASRNSEYVVLKNTGRYSADLTGWTLSDKVGHRYTFPSMRISAGRFLYIRTGNGTNNWYTRYWGSSWYIWNNDGDKAYLRSSSGWLRDSCTWGSTGSATSC
jgi:hypothetical protein